MPALPLVPGSWLPLDAVESLALIPRLDAHLKASGLAAPAFSRQCQLRDLHALPLSFYPGWVLVHGAATMPDGQVGLFDVLLGPGFIWCLDGSSSIIHQINSGEFTPAADPGPDTGAGLTGPLTVMEARRTGPDYVRFFCNSVRSNGGAFRIVESAADLQACGVVSPPPDLVSRLKPLRLRRVQAVAPPTGDAPPQAPSLSATATLLYAGSLFAARLLVTPTGQVQMVDDRSLATDVAPPEVARRWLRNIRPASAPPVRKD